MSVYLRRSLGDYLLCLVLAASSSYVSGGGFYVDPAFQANPLVVGVLPAAVLACLFVTGVSRAARFVGAFGAVAVGVVAVGVAFANAPADAVLADVEGNPLIFTVVVVATTFAVFLLSRTRPGCAVLLCAEVVNVFVVEFLYQHGYVMPTLVCIAAAIALAACTCARRAGAECADREPVRTAAFGFASSVAVGLLAVAVAAGLFVVVVEPLNPQAAPLKLITRVMALEEIEVHGIADVEQVPDENLGSQEESESDDASSSAGDGESSLRDDQTAPSSPLGSLSQAIGAAFSIDSLSQTFTVLGLASLWWVALVVAVLIVAAIACAIALKKHLRARWARRVEGLSPRDQAMEYYRFFVDRLRIAGIERRAKATPHEFASDNESALRRFFGGGAKDGASGDEAFALFSRATEVFERSCYGDCAVTDEDVAPLKTLYRGFYRSCCTYLGRFKYARAFFRL